jgi:hypothetical protein
MAGIPLLPRLFAERSMRSGIPQSLRWSVLPERSQPLAIHQQDIDFSLQNFYFLIKIDVVYADTTNEG